MNITAINGVNFCGAIKPTNAKKIVNRKMLVPQANELKNLYGPVEKKKAKTWVAAYTLGNSGLAALTAQAPGVDELLLSTVEVAMATHIFNGIYNFDFSKTILKALGMGVAGHAIGKTGFRMMTKPATVIPGLGNGLNAAIAGGTTAALGAGLIALAEDMDKARKRGESIDKFIEQMKKAAAAEEERRKRNNNNKK